MMSLALRSPYPLALSTSSLLRPCSVPSIPRTTLSSFTDCKSFCPLPLSLSYVARTQKKPQRGAAIVCRYSITPTTLQWVCTVSSAILMLVRGAPIHKSFLVPLFALQAPSTVMSWIQGEYGGWTAFLALLVRLFYFIPGELELPLITILLVKVAPHQAMSLRGKQAGTIISLAIAGFLALQHFSHARSLEKAFDRGSIVTTIAVICIAAATCLLFL